MAAPGNYGTIGTRELSDAEKQRATQNLIVVSLLAAGVLLVACAEWLGQQSVMHCGAGGGCGWSPEDAYAAANTFRSFGVMSFAAGMAERVILVVKAYRPPVA